MERITMSVTDLKLLQDFFGDKTINQIRSEAGLTDVAGGEKIYMDYIKENSHILPPQLTIAANPFLDGHR